MMKTGTMKLGKRLSGQTSMGALVTPRGAKAEIAPAERPAVTMATVKSKSPSR